jgi:integrase
LSTDAVADLLTKHVAAAAERCPTLTSKIVTPHVLRHTCAMNLQIGGVASNASFCKAGDRAVAEVAA